MATDVGSHPRETGERAEPARLGQERIPGRAGRIHDGLVAAGEDPVAEPALAEVLPHPLDRVQLWAVGRATENSPGRPVRRRLARRGDRFC
jgi:hypothetical protein